MPRRTSSARSKKNTSVKPWQLLILIVLICGAYLYQNGVFDRWLAPYGLGAKPTPVAVGGSNGPLVSLERAVSFDGAWFQVYFTRPDYPERSTNRVGGIDAAIAADIDAAQSTVQIAVFDFDLPLLTEALISAKQRGLVVQMVIDAENLEAPEVVEATGRLETAGIPITYDERPAFMHNKIILIDNRVVWTGSMNLAMTEVYRNNNNMIRTTVAPLVENYTQRFDDLFDGKMGSSARANTPNPVINLENGTQIQTYFSPTDNPRNHLLDALREAKSSVKMMAFSFTDDATAQELIALHNQGVKVQLVMEARSVEGTGSEFNVVSDAGIEAWADGNCYIAHNKVIIIDDRIVITGSYNFTAAAEKSNDENMLIISDPELARLYSAEFDRLLQQAIDAPGCGR